ncbi:MAG: hypothetical protein GY711_18965 [bacterium]|nr:hypothetical protein [bacterium]
MIQRALLWLVALLPLSCAGVSSSQVPFVGAVSAGPPGQTALDVRWDTRIFIARGNLDWAACLFTKGSGLPIYVHGGGGERVIVVNRDIGEELELEMDDPLPPYCRALYAPGEAEQLGVAFKEN